MYRINRIFYKKNLFTKSIFTNFYLFTHSQKNKKNEKENSITTLKDFKVSRILHFEKNSFIQFYSMHENLNVRKSTKERKKERRES